MYRKFTLIFLSIMREREKNVVTLSFISDITLRDNEIMGTPNNVISRPKETTPLTARQQTILELFQTETNYVAILNTILKVIYSSIKELFIPAPLQICT